MSEESKKQLFIDFQKTFATGSGKVVLDALRKRARANVVIVPKDSMGRTDPYEVLYNQGQRSIITYIDHMMTETKIKQKEAQND
tara:strand:- start:10 stop:261 length:252 start_codon:yes stop_codon:yes gene_type:complete